MRDKITELVANALGQARVVRKCLEAKIIPILDPRHRSFASDLSRRIGSQGMIDEAYLRDLEAFIARLGQEVEGETSYAWRGHEHDPDCGRHVPVRSERAEVLLVVLDELVGLATAIEAALDAAKAYAIANALFKT